MTDTRMNGNGQAPGESAAQAEEALNALRRAAMAGDLGAKIDLNKRLLGDPSGESHILEGTAVAVSAANDGDGEAAYRTAILAAGAISMRRDWPTSLVYLQRAAELGYAPAQAELAALSKDRELAARAIGGEDTSGDVWLRLRKAVTLESAMRVPSPKTLSVSPRIAIAENFLSAELCDALIEKARGKLGPVDGPEGDPIPVEVASAYRFGITDLSIQTILTLDRIAEVAGVQHRGLESPAVLRYAGAQDYPSHVDFLDPEAPMRVEAIRREGQRILTFLVFLNDDYEGGETDFPAIAKRVKGKKGDALFWWNVRQDGTPDRATVNANLAVAKGEKWLLSQWIRGPVPLPPRQKAN